MDPIRRFSRPELRRPAAIIAFEGWNDACDAASGAVTYLLGQSDVTDPFAVLDPEDFFDFQQHRPTIHIDESGPRQLTWPATEFFAAPQPAAARDLVLVLGDEPSHRWKTFSRSIAGLLTEVGVEEAVLLGAFIGQVPHSSAVPVIGVASDPELLRGDDLPGSGYEGPTGIVAVLQEAFREVGIPTVSLWAATPHYLAANPNPKAMLALVERAGRVLAIDFDTTELATVAREFSRRVEEAVRSSKEFSQYVTELERRSTDDDDHELDDSNTEAFVAEIEDFLRKRS